jgi:hypothetical protein
MRWSVGIIIGGLIGVGVGNELSILGLVTMDKYRLVGNPKSQDPNQEKGRSFYYRLTN